MEQRSISEAAITEILLTPDQTYLDGEKFVAERLGADDKPLRVVYTRQDDVDGLVVSIVTVYRIRKLKRL